MQIRPERNSRTQNQETQPKKIASVNPASPFKRLTFPSASITHIHTHQSRDFRYSQLLVIILSRLVHTRVKQKAPYIYTEASFTKPRSSRIRERTNAATFDRIITSPSPELHLRHNNARARGSPLSLRNRRR